VAHIVQAANSNSRGQKPNLVIFNPDQFRGDVLGHLGNPGAVTPNLDQWVEAEAVSFKNTFCQNPVCTPSRCSFMTGWYPHTRGHRTMHYMLQPDEPNLLQSLKEAGYTLWWGGKNDLFPGQNSLEKVCDIRHPPPDPRSRPARMDFHAYDAWRGQPEEAGFFSFYYGKIEKQASDEAFAYDSDWHHVLGAAAFIKEAPKDQPFCIYLPLGFPHPPYGVEDPWYGLIDREKVPQRIPTPEDWSQKPSILQGIYAHQGLSTWTEERWWELRATYYGMCSRVDHQLGIILAALREAGHYDDTAVFFFADHGDFTGDYGLVEKTQNTFEDCLTHVPLVIKPPKAFPTQPGVREALVELVDFPATVYELLGIEPGYTHFGRSLCPVLAGTQDEHRQAVFCEGGRVHGEEEAMEPMPAQDVERWLYYPRVHLQHSAGPEHTKAVMCRTRDYKYVHRLYEMDELYDLRADPAELHNLSADPTLASLKGTFQERLIRFFMETGDVVPHQLDTR
jgi:arylsulfatase A-like enzyme